MRPVGLSLAVDGRGLVNLESFRVVSGLIDISLTDNNVFQLRAGHASAVADGYYVLIEPLAVGKHTIHFTGTFTDISWGQDVTYDVTIVPKKRKR